MKRDRSAQRRSSRRPAGSTRAFDEADLSQTAVEFDVAERVEFAFRLVDRTQGRETLLGIPFMQFEMIGDEPFDRLATMRA